MNINEMKVSWILITLALLYWPSSQHDMPITKRSLSTITKRPEVSIVTAPQVQKKAASTPLPETNASKTDVHVHRTPFQGMECGKTISNIGHNRIIGGQEAIQHSWPWQALITCTIRNSTSVTICGGNLLSDKWILTAAHCLIPTQFTINVVADCSVGLGKHYFGNGKYRDRAEASARISSYYVHPQYDGQSVISGYDIALVRLAGAVKLNQRIKPICLPFGLPELKLGSTCFTAGWGFTNPKMAKQSPVLKQLEMEVQDVDYCEFTTDTVGPIICAGELDAWPDICLGDSGGPLSCRAKDGRWYLRGVASMVDGNCRGVASFTKVSAFLDWITHTISSPPWR